LETAPIAGDIVMETQNQELYHMLVTSFMKGSGMHILQNMTLNDNGNAAFVAIQDWYGSASTSRTIINHYRKKVESLTLNQKSTASKFVNVFIICCQKLEESRIQPQPQRCQQK
jgi:hypothetical protein